mmetsp:Transcript_70931/g.142773  ORF Transcript_70931/g.142773 Transcript_70931/m.142773 type:complete len:285 (-) Transcript_70931:215-1069(-)
MSTSLVRQVRPDGMGHSSSPWLPCIKSTCSLLRFDTFSGTLPVRALWLKLRTAKDAPKVPRPESATGPVSLLNCRHRRANLGVDRALSFVGRGPVRLLLDKSRTSKRLSPHTQGGTGPVSRLPERSSSFSAPKPPKPQGRPPVRAFPARHSLRSPEGACAFLLVLPFFLCALKGGGRKEGMGPVRWLQDRSSSRREGNSLFASTAAAAAAAALVGLLSALVGKGSLTTEDSLVGLLSSSSSSAPPPSPPSAADAVTPPPCPSSSEPPAPRAEKLLLQLPRSSEP